MTFLAKTLSTPVRHIVNGLVRNPNASITVRNASIYSESGGILSKPSQVHFGVLKATAIIFPTVYIGSTISKNGAAFLEEQEIFVPDDDD